MLCRLTTRMVYPFAFVCLVLTSAAAPIPGHHYTFDAPELGFFSRAEEPDPFGGNIANLFSTVYSSLAPRGHSLFLDGTNSAVVLSETITFDTNEDFAISLWLRPDFLSTGPGSITGCVLGSRKTSHFIRVQESTIRLSFSDKTTTLAPLRLFKPRVWQHVGLSRRNGQLSAFCGEDGFATIDFPHAFEIDYIGARNLFGPFEERFQGGIDDVRIFRHALNPADFATFAGFTDDQTAFSLMANTAFTTANANALTRYVTAENVATPASEFILHLGNQFAPQASTLPITQHQTAARRLKGGLTAPPNRIATLAVPGNNDWAIQDAPLTALDNWKSEFLNLQQQFLGSVGLNFPTRVFNEPTYPETVSFLHNNILFHGLNLPSSVPGGLPDWAARIQATIDWLDSTCSTGTAPIRHRWSLDETSAPFADTAGFPSEPISLSAGLIQAGQPAPAPRPGTSVRLNGGSLSLTTPFQAEAEDSATFSAWIQPERFPAPLFGNLFGNTDSIVVRDDTRVRVRLGNVTRDLNLSGRLALDRWQHVALTYNRGHLAFYVNGRLLGTSDNAFREFTFTRIGAGDGTTFLGHIDNIEITGLALTSREVAARAGRAGHWPLDALVRTPSFPNTYGGPALIGNQVLVGQSGFLGRSVSLSATSSLSFEAPIAFAPNENFLISMHIRPTDLRNGTVLGTADRSHSVRVDESNIILTFDGTPTSIPLSFPFRINEWQHLLLSRKAGTLRIYRNGALITTQQGLTDGFHFDRVGRDGNSAFRGKIDDLRVLPTPYADLNSMQRNALFRPDDVRQLVIFANARPDGGPEKIRQYALAAFLQRFANGARYTDTTRKPILYLHGDAGVWQDETNFLGQPNLRRVAINPTDASHPPVQVFVNDRQTPAEAFAFNRRGLPAASGATLVQNYWTTAHQINDPFRSWYFQNIGSFDFAKQMPEDDADRDRSTLFEEYVFNTDPTRRDPIGTLLDIQYPLNGNTTISMPSGRDGIRYILESAESLGEEWTVLSDSPRRTGSRWTFDIPPQPVRCFYRLRADLP